MKAVLQRVTHAKVNVNGELVGKIDKGLLVFLGIANDDNQSDSDYLIRKIINLRIFNDSDFKMNLSLKDVNGELLVISQFTLYADTQKGNRPSYTAAAQPIVAKEIYNSFLSKLEMEFGKKVEAGIFGADMKVELLNDGPVTIIVDSKN
jgi:D-tyrosyl-tRNA(Tyr) deacylase